jgi:membrane associated rhomboid family serine protease
MPLDNRRYYRTLFSERSPYGVKWLLIANIGIFIPTFFLSRTSFIEHLRVFFLVPEAVVGHFAIWQLVTYMFLHGSISHILFNMLALYFFGTPLERDWGSKRFLRYYFLCGIGAGICDIILNLALGNNTRTIGASGAIYGLLLAFGVLYPNSTVFMYFVFPIKAKYMVMIVGAIAFLGATQVNSGVSDIAHLGGMLFGYAYLKLRFVDFGTIGREYEAWKLRRARKRFQVYMKKHNRSDDRWTQ